MPHNAKERATMITAVLSKPIKTVLKGGSGYVGLNTVAYFQRDQKLLGTECVHRFPERSPQSGRRFSVGVPWQAPFALPPTRLEASRAQLQQGRILSHQSVSDLARGHRDAMGAHHVEKRTGYLKIGTAGPLSIKGRTGWEPTACLFADLGVQCGIRYGCQRKTC